MSQLEQSFAILETRLTPEVAASLQALVALEVGQTREGRRELDLRRQQCPFVQPRGTAPASCTLRIAADADWLELLEGRLTATAALLAGKLKVDGDLTVAMRLERLVLATSKR